MRGTLELPKGRYIGACLASLVLLAVATVGFYGQAQKRHSSEEEFSAAERIAFQAYGADPESHFVHLAVSNMRTHYLEQGRGSPLLAIHGGNSMSAAWAPLVKSLAGTSRPILVDRPGCGLTDKLNYRGIPFRRHSVEFTRSFLNAVSVEKTSIIANSMGGYFALAFALAYPERVDKLILIGSPPMINTSAPWALTILGIPGLNRFIYAVKATKESLGIHNAPPSWRYANPAKLRPEAVEVQAMAEALPGAEESWLSMVEEVIRNYKTGYNLRKELIQIRARVLFIIGDREDGVDTTRQLEDAMPRARKATIRNAGHIPWVDDTDACQRLILDFPAEKRTIEW